MTINTTNTITPKFLKNGDCIEIVAPAKFVLLQDVKFAIDYIENEGYKVKINSDCFSKKNVFAGSISQRTECVQSALNNNESQVILFARGGYGSIQIIDNIDFTIFSKNPKWLVGFSDTTSLLLHSSLKHHVKSMQI